MAENFAKLSAAHPACKLIVRTFEESKFHAHTIMIKFGVEITTAPLSHKKVEGNRRERLCSRSRSVDKNSFGAPESGPLTPPPLPIPYHHHGAAAEVYVRRGA